MRPRKLLHDTVEELKVWQSSCKRQCFGPVLAEPFCPQMQNQLHFEFTARLLKIPISSIIGHLCLFFFPSWTALPITDMTRKKQNVGGNTEMQMGEREKGGDRVRQQQQPQHTLVYTHTHTSTHSEFLGTAWPAQQPSVLTIHRSDSLTPSVLMC